MRLPTPIVLALVAACLEHPASPPPVTEGTRLLFIGNSLTYVHDVPALVTAIARQVGDDDLGAIAVAFPDYALEDHWHDGSAQRALQSQGWDFVILQQGPSSLPESRVHLEHWAQQFAPAIRAAGAVPVLYAGWPHVLRRGDAARALASYANAAQAIQGRLAPVGAAWDSVLVNPADVALYSTDGLHASPYGAWLAAVVLYATVRGIDPVTLPPTLPRQVAAPALSADQVRLLLRRGSSRASSAASVSRTSCRSRPACRTT